MKNRWNAYCFKLSFDVTNKQSMYKEVINDITGPPSCDNRYVAPAPCSYIHLFIEINFSGAPVDMKDERFSFRLTFTPAWTKQNMFDPNTW